MAFERQVAHRLFAEEFNASSATIEGEGEKDPSFVVTPLGAKVNRLHVVGVCTAVEPVGEAGDVYRARISDPSGVFTVYAGQYQAEAAHQLSQLEPPVFVAVTGKARTYQPEEGSVFTSIRPEVVSVVDEAERDQWVLDAARRTSQRLDNEPAAELATQHYGSIDKDRFRDATKRCLTALVGGSIEVHEGESEGAAPAAPTWTPSPEAEASSEEDDALDETIGAIVTRLSGDEGARWDDILEAAKAEGGHDAEAVEESLNRLMDKGLVYEPTLGVLKAT